MSKGKVYTGWEDIVTGTKPKGVIGGVFVCFDAPIGKKEFERLQLAMQLTFPEFKLRFGPMRMSAHELIEYAKRLDARSKKEQDMMKEMLSGQPESPPKESENE